MKLPTTLLLHIILFVVVTVKEIRSQALPYEPMSVIKTLLGSASYDDLPMWKQLTDGGSQMRSALQSAVKPLLRKGQAILLSVRGKLVLQEVSGGVKLTNTLVMPNANVLSLMGASIPIFFEGYKPELLSDKFGSVLKGSDKSLASGYETKSLLELLNVVPTEENPVSFWSQFNKQSERAFQVANKLLGATAQEAWRDSFMAVEMDDAEFDSGTIKTQLSFVVRFGAAVLNEIKSLDSLKKIPLQHSDRFAFGWWLNCEKKSASCFLPSAPGDTVFSVSSQLRIYTTPSLDTVMIIADSSSKLPDSFDAIMKADDRVWQEIRKTIAPKEEVKLPQEETIVTQEAKGEKKVITEEDSTEGEETWQLPAYFQVFIDYFSTYLAFLETLNWFYRGLIFAVFVLVSHFLCYCGFHTIWLLGTMFSKTLHETRPRGSHNKDD